MDKVVNKCYVVKTLKEMNWLCRHGFECIKLEKDKYNDEYRVFVFEDSKELRRAVWLFHELKLGKASHKKFLEENK